MLYQKGEDKGLILPIKGYRPLDSKSIAHMGKFLLLKEIQ